MVANFIRGQKIQALREGFVIVLNLNRLWFEQQARQCLSRHLIPREIDGPIIGKTLERPPGGRAVWSLCHTFKLPQFSLNGRPRRKQQHEGKHQELITTYEGVSSADEKSPMRALVCLVRCLPEREDTAEARVCKYASNGLDPFTDVRTRSVSSWGLVPFCFFDGGTADLSRELFTDRR